MSVSLPLPPRLHTKPIKDYFNNLMSVVAQGVEAETEKRMKMMTLFGEVAVDKDGYGESPQWSRLAKYFAKPSDPRPGLTPLGTMTREQVAEMYPKGPA